jgi:hypothetical protein
MLQPFLQRLAGAWLVRLASAENKTKIKRCEQQAPKSKEKILIDVIAKPRDRLFG